MTLEQLHERIEDLEDMVNFLEKGNAFSALTCAALVKRIIRLEEAVASELNVDLGGIPMDLGADIERLIKGVAKDYGIRK